MAADTVKKSPAGKLKDILEKLRLTMGVMKWLNVLMEIQAYVGL